MDETNNKLSVYEKNRERLIKYQVDRYLKDEEFRTNRLNYCKEYGVNRYKNDLAYKEAKKAKNNEYQRKLREARDALLKLGLTA